MPKTAASVFLYEYPAKKPDFLKAENLFFCVPVSNKKQLFMLRNTSILITYYSNFKWL